MIFLLTLFMVLAVWTLGLYLEASHTNRLRLKAIANAMNLVPGATFDMVMETIVLNEAAEKSRDVEEARLKDLIASQSTQLLIAGDRDSKQSTDILKFRRDIEQAATEITDWKKRFEAQAIEKSKLHVDKLNLQSKMSRLERSEEKAKELEETVEAMRERVSDLELAIENRDSLLDNSEEEVSNLKTENEALKKFIACVETFNAKMKQTIDKFAEESRSNLEVFNK